MEHFYCPGVVAGHVFSFSGGHDLNGYLVFLVGVSI